ncbi:hypothetical protein K488DRAFT_69041 [Vararia minispora EC-137]|uniref:Uncharacterized protein n=1 Tax=Vararia minispora EC-137 TaxID=1314806 RepID=A0ACB8QSA1_9AGAM|nr:hypothetical protein K488DRAFT_69041 [Vararia minispora EC-137]
MTVYTTVTGWDIFGWTIHISKTLLPGKDNTVGPGNILRSNIQEGIRMAVPVGAATVLSSPFAMSVQRMIKSIEQATDKPSEIGLSPPRRKPLLRLSIESNRKEVMSDLDTFIRRSRVLPPRRTPTSSHTFGRPDMVFLPAPPTHLTRPMSASVLSIPSSATVGTSNRRAERYSRDESALATAATPTLPEFSPRQLQQFELARAAGLLATRADAARTRLQELRVALADPDLALESRQALQRERWMEEHWLAAAEEEQRRVKDTADTLKVAPVCDSPPTVAPASAVTADAQARWQANLAKFFASSPTQIEPRARRAFPATSHSPRVMSATDIEPPRLRAWPITSDMQRAIIVGSRPRSLDRRNRSAISAASILGHGSARRKVPPPLLIGCEKLSNATTPKEWVYSAPAYTQNVCFPVLKVQETDPVDIAFGRQRVFDAFPLPTPPGIREGSAVIYFLSSGSPRSYEEILAEEKDQLDVSIPDYVANLLDELDGPSRAPTALLSHDWTSSPTIAFAQPSGEFARPSVDSLVVVARPSVDSYHYSTLPSHPRKPRQLISSSLRHNLRLSHSFDASDLLSPDTAEHAELARPRQLESPAVGVVVPSVSGEERRCHGTHA